MRNGQVAVTIWRLADVSVGELAYLKEPTRSTLEPTVRHYRTIFISDVHLGTKGCQADRLLEFLKNHTCDHLFLVGDIIDGWQLKSSFYWPDTHMEVIREVLRFLKQDTKVTYVTGNHDEFLRKYSDTEFGDLRLVDSTNHETADGRSLLVIHGDQFDVVTRYHKWVAVLGDFAYSILLVVNQWLNWWRERFGYDNWSLSAWVKGKVKSAVNYLSNFESSVVKECQRQNYDGVVCGHIHHAEHRDFDGIEYYNCGDWVESCTALLEDETGKIVVYVDQSPKSNVTKIRTRRSRTFNRSRKVAAASNDRRYR